MIVQPINRTCSR